MYTPLNQHGPTHYHRTLPSINMGLPIIRSVTPSYTPLHQYGPTRYHRTLPSINMGPPVSIVHSSINMGPPIANVTLPSINMGPPITNVHSPQSTWAHPLLMLQVLVLEVTHTTWAHPLLMLPVLVLEVTQLKSLQSHFKALLILKFVISKIEIATLNQ